MNCGVEFYIVGRDPVSQSFLISKLLFFEDLFYK